jgi:hypothetical protein
MTDRYTVTIPAAASESATTDALEALALLRATQSGLRNPAVVGHGTPTTRDGVRSLWVQIESDTPAEYDRASGQVIPL